MEIDSFLPHWLRCNAFAIAFQTKTSNWNIDMSSLCPSQFAHCAFSFPESACLLFHLRSMAATTRIALRMRCDVVTCTLGNSQRFRGYKVALEESFSKKRLRSCNKRILLARVDISISRGMDSRPSLVRFHRGLGRADEWSWTRARRCWNAWR